LCSTACRRCDPDRLDRVSIRALGRPIGEALWDVDPHSNLGEPERDAGRPGTGLRRYDVQLLAAREARRQHACGTRLREALPLRVSTRVLRLAGDEPVHQSPRAAGTDLYAAIP